MSFSVVCLDCGCHYLLVREEGSVIQKSVCPRCGFPGWAPAGSTAVGAGSTSGSSSRLRFA